MRERGGVRYDFTLQNSGESGGSGVSGAAYRSYTDEISDGKFSSSEMDKYAKGWSESLNAEERYGVLKYSMQGYQRINKSLAEGKTEPEVKGIDDALGRYSLSHNLMTYREDDGGTFGFKGLSAEQINGLKGGHISVKSYVSTTLDGKYFSENPRYSYSIKVPKGKGRGAYIAHSSDFPNESEFLIKRGANFRIDGAKASGGGVLVDLTMLR